MRIHVNLFEEQFYQVASEEAIELHKDYEPGSSKLITFMPGADYNDDLRVKTLGLEIPYKKQIIAVEYQVGDIQMAQFNCELKHGLRISDFKITYRSHYTRLFLKKNILKVASSDQYLKKYLEDKLMENGLEVIARNNLFTPIMESKKTIKTDFSLSFEDRKKVLNPMIQFYKDLIDFCIQHKI